MQLAPGGADRSRTDGLLSANQALSQLSYSPSGSTTWRINLRPVGRDPGYARAFPLISNIQVENTEGESSTEPSYPGRELLLEWNGCPSFGTPPTFSLRKEVIQPQVLLRLPCYDFTPIMNHTLGRCPPCGSACGLLVQSTFVM